MSKRAFRKWGAYHNRPVVGSVDGIIGAVPLGPIIGVLINSLLALNNALENLAHLPECFIPFSPINIVMPFLHPVMILVCGGDYPFLINDKNAAGLPYFIRGKKDG